MNIEKMCAVLNDVVDLMNEMSEVYALRKNKMQLGATHSTLGQLLAEKKDLARDFAEFVISLESSIENGTNDPRQIYLEAMKDLHGAMVKEIDISNINELRKNQREFQNAMSGLVKVEEACHDYVALKPLNEVVEKSNNLKKFQ
jgi:hypothetical protein